MLCLVYWSLLMLAPVENITTDYNHQSYYNIIRNDKVIGYMKCSKRESSETIEYINESSAKFSALVSISVYSKLQSSFRNGILQDGKLIRQVNGKTKSDRQITKLEDRYLIKTDGKSASIKSSINFTTACLMYVEPAGMQYIFSENFGKYIEVVEASAHKYVLRLPDGSDNTYTYHNGKCVEVEVQTTLATVYIRPRQ